MRINSFNISRGVAALTHLFLSIIIFSIVVSLMIFEWYPLPHFYASGGWDGIKIAAGVDLVLGPVLTLVAFNPNKPKKVLINDLMVIMLIQFSALAWGGYTVYQQRPLAMVFFGDSFYSISALAYSKQNNATGKLQQFGTENPVLVYVKSTFNETKKSNRNNIPAFHRLDLYEPFKDKFLELSSNLIFQVDIETSAQKFPQLKKKLKSFLDENDALQHDYIYFRLFSDTHNIILIFNKDGKLESYINIPYYKWYEMVYNFDF